MLGLQESDLALDRLRERKRDLESGEDLRVAREALEQAENELGELRLALDAVQREQARLDGDIDSMSRKAEAEEKRLYDGSVSNAKELEAIQHEIANIKHRRARVEDDLLEQMERREDLEGRVTAAASSAETARASLEATGGDEARELEEILTVLAEREAERATLASSIDQDLLDLYEDLRQTKHGTGAAALVAGVCQGCHQKLSALEIDKLKKVEGVKRCDYCRRILIFV